MEAWGFPNNTRVRAEDLKTEAEQVIWLDILDYGAANCGWKIRQPLVG